MASKLLIVLVVFVCVCSSGCIDVSAPSTTGKDFERFFLPHWPKVSAKYGNFSAQVRMMDYADGVENEVYSNQLRKLLDHSVTVNSGEVEYVSLFNPSYRATISKRDSGYFLETVKQNGNYQMSLYKDFTHLRSPSIPFNQLARSSLVNLTRFEDARFLTSDCKMLSLTKKEVPTDAESKSMTLYFDKQDGKILGVLTEKSAKDEFDAVVYKYGKNGQAESATAFSDCHIPNPLNVTEVKGDPTLALLFDKFDETANLDREEFFLSHYGLPEPPFSSKRSNPYLWAYILGSGALAVAFICGGYLVRRRL